MDPALRARLIEWLGVDEVQVYDVEGMLDLGDLWQIAGLDGHPDIRQPPWTPLTHPAFVPGPSDRDDQPDVFAPMRTRDVLVHYPYQSFATSVERFVKQAVDDPNVLAIKMTVYRTSDDSALVPSLIEAAEKGKQAVCLVELKARFDERQNIGWSRALEEVGAHVVHGIPGLKTHAKAILVVRRERGGVRHYVMIGTGNFHAKNARLYEDFGLFTTDREIGQEVANLFNTLTGYGHPARERKVLVAPELDARAADRGDRPDDRRARGRRAGADRDEDELAGRPGSASRRCTAPRRPASRSTSTSAGSAACSRACPASARRSTSSRSSGGSSSTRGSTRSIAATRHVYYIGSADLMPRNLDTRVELLDAGRGSRASARARGHARALLRRRHVRVDARRRGRLDPAHRADAQRPPRADGADAPAAGLDARGLNRPWPALRPATAVRSFACVLARGPTGPSLALIRRSGWSRSRAGRRA